MEFTETTVSLEQSCLEAITREAALIPEVERIILFGSRALATSHKGSDIDLALTGQDVTHSTVLFLHDVLNHETLIPYQVDVLDYNTILNPALKEHIKHYGVVIYKKKQEDKRP